MVQSAAVQRGRAAAPLAAAVPHVAVLAVRDLDVRQRGHVAGTLHHHRHQPAPRLPAVLVGPVQGDDLGLGNVHRHDRPVPVADLPVHPLPADDLDFRDADDRPRRQRRQRVHDGPGAGARDWSRPMSTHPTGKKRSPIYGLMAEFHDSDELIEAAYRVREAGYTRLDAYTPYPIEEVAEATGHHHSKLPLIVLIGGIVGAIAGYGLQYWAAVIEYPLNIGGRPLHSWPAFIVPTFEMTILFAALSAVFGMFFLNGLPQPYHPVFNVPRFALASRDRYFLLIDARDPLFDREGTRRFLADLNPTEVNEVEH